MKKALCTTSRVTMALALSLVALLFPRAAHAEWPSLDSAVRLSRTRALAALEAEAEVAQANGALTGAKVSVFGNPYLEMQFDRGTLNPQLQALGFLYFPVELLGQRGARVDEAEKYVNWRKLGLVDARAYVTGETVSTWGEVVIARSRMDLATDGEAAARKEAEFFSERLKAGDTTQYEASLAEAEVARWVQARVEAQLKMATAMSRLTQLTAKVDIGAPPKEISASGPPRLKGSWDDAYLTQALERSPLLAKIRGQRDFYSASIDRYKAERLPQFTFELIGGRGADRGEGRYGAGFVLGFPFTRRYQGEIAKAEAARDHAASHYELYKRVLDTRMRTSRTTLLEVGKAIDQLEKSGIPALTRAVDAAFEAYKLGKTDISRVLLTRRDLANTRSRRLDLLEIAWRAYGDLTTFSGDLP